MEIEEEAEIGFEDALEVAPLNRNNVGDDVRTDHPTSMLGGEEVPVPTMFSDQEVPEDEAGQRPEEVPKITSLPVTDDAAFEVREELLYNNIATLASERALTVDNEDVQGFLNLGEIFSFHNFEESKDELFRFRQV